MIIIEGMDNSGKTTLCSHLTKRFDLEVDIRNRPYTLRQGFKMISDSVFKGDKMIYDRHVLISEIVYGPIIRGSSIFGNSNWDLIWLILRTNPLIIYCRPPTAKIFKFGIREQMDGVINQKESLVRRYDWVMDVVDDSILNCYNPLVRYDYTEKGSLKTIEGRIKRHLTGIPMYDEARKIDIKDECKLEES